MSRQLWPNLSVGVCWPLCMPLLGVYVLSEWVSEWVRERNGRVNTMYPGTVFLGHVQPWESTCSFILWGHLNRISPLFSSWSNPMSLCDLTLPPPAWHPPPPIPHHVLDFYPCPTICSLLIPLSAPISKPDPDPDPFTILSSLLMVSVQHPSTSLPHISPFLPCICPIEA